MSKIDRVLQEYPPRYGPEWGSGGIFGLKYFKGVLYYTLAFEASAYFVDDEILEYRFSELGPGPASGGDTYNAVDVVDDKIFFGGWVHNPAVFKGKKNHAGEIDFRNKYSHVHEYDVRERKVRLLWKESIHDEFRWAGEVSQIIYDPVKDVLIIGRSDGMENLGVYELSRDGRIFSKLSEVPALKGSLYLDYACFDMQPDWMRGVEGIQCLDLVRRVWVRHTIEDWAEVSLDGYGVSYRTSGYAASAYTRYWHFMRGGVLVGNPVEPEVEKPTFVRLFDFGMNVYAPHRSNALNLGGGILAVFNASTHGFLHPHESSSGEADLRKYFNTVVAPTALVYITPPQARIVATFGARITSMTKAGSRILIAYNTTPNLGGKDSTPVDGGVRGIMSVDEYTLLSSSNSPLTIRVPGWAVGDACFGGIPLTGFKEAELFVRSSKHNEILINIYDIGLPPLNYGSERLKLSEGLNKIDLRSYRDIVSFKLEKPDENALINIYLR
ncbi:MAG: DUF2139 domain-containing protein [Zestosphaera sp.]